MKRWSNRVLLQGSRLVGRQANVESAKTSHDRRLADRQARHHMSSLAFLELSAEAALTENMAFITHQTQKVSRYSSTRPASTERLRRRQIGAS